MRVPVLAAVLALSACSSPHTANSSADVKGAAEEAQGDIDTYAANSLARTPAALPVTPSPTPIAAPTAAPTQPGTVAKAPFTDDSAQGAADVVQTYFALIEARKYGQAWALWDDGGRASGMSRRQFADSFAKYAEYHAEVGAPGRVDAGAGQRYVEVPVRAYGLLADGKRPFTMRGSVTLHRTAEIDGATTEQKSWRIRDSSLRPRPAEATAAVMQTDATAKYRCAGVTRVSARSENKQDGIWRRSDPAGPTDAAATAPCTTGN